MKIDHGFRCANGARQMQHQSARFFRRGLRQGFRAGPGKGFEKTREMQIECHDITL
ncbi:hypothetical protein [Burkholderia sp. SIMBA_019]|uniref:hypothetical protein n=1 Tax=Burkholderia sp. SIMBA_019 TaxID=3085765 RepID=UPI00397DFE92